MRALFLGLGGIGQRHLRNLRTLLGPECHISAFRTRRETHELTNQLTIKPDGNVETSLGVEVFTSLSAALEERPDIAIVANPTSLHVESTRLLLERGVDVLLEKPLSHTLEGTSELVHLAEERGRICLVAFQLRFHPLVQALEKEIRREAVGQLYGAEVEVGEYLPGFHPYEDYRRMYASRKDQGGGVILTQIHELDLLTHLFGLPERALCVGGRLSELEIDVEDSATSLLAYRRRDGVPYAVTLRQDYLARPARRRFEVWGENGRLSLNLRSGTLDFESTSGERRRLAETPNLDRNDLFLDEMRHFLRCVETRERPVVSLNDGLMSLRLALALQRSLQTGEAEKVSS